MVRLLSHDPETSVPPEHAGAESADDPARVLFSWRSHPAKQGGRKLWIALGAMVGIPLALWPLYGPFFGLMALVILGGSLFPFFLPTRYVLYAGGLESVFLGVHRRFMWSQFRSYYPDPNGVLLSPFAHPSRLENFRGIYLRYDGQSEHVLRIIAERVVPPVPDTAGKDAVS